jgi:hypothetical protein
LPQNEKWEFEMPKVGADAVSKIPQDTIIGTAC